MSAGDKVARLIAAGGIDTTDLSPQGEAILTWLGGWGPDTVDAVAELLEAARAAGYEAAYTEHRGRGL